MLLQVATIRITKKRKRQKVTTHIRTNKNSYTSLGGTSKIFDAAKNISGAGFRFSNASADTIASNLMIRLKLYILNN